jgi:hypothetical protein
MTLASDGDGDEANAALLAPTSRPVQQPPLVLRVRVCLPCAQVEPTPTLPLPLPPPLPLPYPYPYRTPTPTPNP